MKIVLDDPDLSRLFPSYMVVDRQLVLLQVGPGLCAASDGPEPGRHLLDYFRWSGDDPQGDFARIAKNAEFVRLSCKQDRALLDGTVVPIDQGYLLAMNQVPAAFSLDGAALQMSDFGMADTMVPGLLLISMQRALLEESRQIARELAAERERNVYLIERGRRFAGYTAHDFNNLLSIITLNATRIAQSVLIPEDIRRRISIIQETASRGSEIASSLMTLSNQKHDSPQVIAVDALLAEQQGYFGHIAGGTVDLLMNLQAGGATVLASTSGLLNSVINLVINARQAMPDGGTIAVATTVQPVDIKDDVPTRCLPVDCVTISVSDTGRGMPEHVMRQVFEPFYSTKPHGSGMGLASVLEFARELGGDARCHSTPGAGATFEIHLPLIDAAAATPAARAAPARDAKWAQAGADISVLLVEDEPYAREALGEMLVSSGFVLTSAGTAEEGRAHLERRHFDILLTDVKLHEASGIDLATLAWRNRHVDRVILMSGYVPEVDELDSAWGFVRKPVDVEHLFQMMRSSS